MLLVNVRILKMVKNLDLSVTQLRVQVPLWKGFLQKFTWEKKSIFGMTIGNTLFHTVEHEKNLNCSNCVSEHEWRFVVCLYVEWQLKKYLNLPFNDNKVNVYEKNICMFVAKILNL